MEVHQVAVRTIAAILAALLASAAAALALDDGFVPVLLASSSAAASGQAYEFPTNGLCVRFELSSATGTNNLVEATNGLSIVAGRGTTIIEGVGLTTTNATGNCASYAATTADRAPESTDRLTVNAWVKWLTLADRDTLLYGSQFIIRQSGTNGNLSIYLYTGPYMMTLTNVCQTSSYQMLTFTYDGTKINGYVDGTLRGQYSLSGQNITFNTTTRLGSDGATDTAQMIVDSIHKWSVALTPTQISDLYTGTKGSK